MKKLEISQLSKVEGGSPCGAAVAGCAAGAAGLFGFGPIGMGLFFAGCAAMGCR
jgi:hypothetical protein